MKRWKVIVCILIPLLMLATVIGFIAISHGETVEEEYVAKLMMENEENPESGKYLVTDKYISRVSPNTEVKDFKKNFAKGEDVKVYEDKACQKEIKEGHVYSGMYAKYENNGKVLEVSVLGDIPTSKNKLGDGDFNQIELTRQIRHYVETKGWKIEKAEDIQSADITCDKNIDDKDINSSIKYIVYDKLEIPDVKKVEAPKIEVTEGAKFGEDKYTGKVKIKVEQVNKKEDSKKTVYKITGDKITDYIEIKDGASEFTLEKEGIYKVTAYTYGKLDNKSKASTMIVKISNGSKAYRVEHYQETLEEGVYELAETENLTGKVGSEVKVTPKEYVGFSYNEKNSDGVNSGKLELDKDLTLKLYYTRNSYKLTLDKNENIEKVQGAGSFKYEQVVNIDATVQEDVGEGYTAKWDSWKIAKKVRNPETGNVEIQEVTALKDKKAKFKMPAQNITMKAVATKELSEYDYEINIYIDGEKDDSLKITGKEKYGTVINDKLPTIEEYEIKNQDNYPMTIGAGRNVANIYYEIKNYNITYDLDGGEFTEGAEYVDKYNYKTPTFVLTTPVKEGYIFAGWTGSNGEVPQKTVEIAKGSKGDKEYKANWIVSQSPVYKVIHYLERLDGTYKLQSEEYIEAEVGDVVTAVPNTYTGFTYDDVKSNSTKTGTITAGENLVLKLYYARNRYELTLIKGQNIGKVKINNEENTINENNKVQTVKYQEEVNISAEVIEEEGYTVTWQGWQSADVGIIGNIGARETTFNMPAGNVTLTANADKNINKYKYTIKYYKNNEKFEEKEKEAVSYGTIITTYEGKNLPGYELDTEKTGTISLRIGTNENQNVINVYYKTITYGIGYRNIENTTFLNENPVEYTVETDSFTLSNPEKPGYDFIGWTGGVINSLGEVDNEVAAGTTGNITVPSITTVIEKGSIGNRIYTANYEAKSGIKYTVEHYTEKLDGTYELYSKNENLFGRTDEEVTANPITIEGFTYDEVKSTPTISGRILPDGSLVLKVYYSRNSYTLTLNKNEYIDKVIAGETNSEESIQKTYKYEEPVSISATLKEITGYTVTFIKWQTGNDVMGNLANIEETFNMPAGDAVLTACAEKEVNKYGYTIKYFYNNIENEAKRITGTEDYGKIIDSYPNKVIDGYELDEVKTGTVNLIITETEVNNVINIYYKPIVYSIECVLNDGALAEGQENASEYTIVSENISLLNPTKKGYVFKGWTGGTEAENPGTTANTTVPSDTVTILTGSMGNRTYTANWEEANYNYTVEYYYEGNTETEFNIDASKTETKQAKYNTIVSTYTDNVKTGYELRETPTPITISYNEEENVLKVYYKKKTHTLTLQQDDNIQEVTGAGTYKYGETVDINASLKTIDGYTITWSKWESNTTGIEDKLDRAVAITIPDSDVILKATATKVADTYEINYMLNGGTDPQNPTSYTIESEDILLTNPTKQGYVFEGWTGGTEKENPGTTANITEPSTSVTIKQGSMGDRLYTAHWAGDSETPYKVEHYKEKLDGTYELAETTNETGTTGETAIAAKKTYEGFEYDSTNTNNLPEAEIKSDGSLVLKVYYRRIISTLKLVAGDNISSVSYSVKDNLGAAEGTVNSATGTEIQVNFKYGTQINISAVLNTETGYTITWNSWKSNAVDKIVDQAGREALIGIPVGDVTLTAKATKTVNSYEYTVEYYYDEVKDNDKTYTSNANYGTVISNVTDKVITGYELDRKEGTPLTITETEANNLIKVYYKQIVYTLTCNLDGGSYKEGESNPESYTVNTESFTLSEPEKAGYEFLGWTGSNGEEAQKGITIAKGSTGNREYTANWRANTDTRYVIEHYKENLDGTYTKDEDVTEKYGTSGETVTVGNDDIRTYTGFSHDSSNTNAVESGVVKGDGSLVLKVYYKRNIYTLRLLAGDNVESVTYTASSLSNIQEGYNLTSSGTDIEVKAKYGAEIAINATLATEENYNITNGKWTSNNANISPISLSTTVTIPVGDATLTASATKTGNSYKYYTQYYYENVLDYTQERTAEFNKQITTYSTRNRTGYVIDEVVGLPLKITANEETNVIKVYYKLENYTINYDLQGGELENNAENPSSYNIETETFTLIKPVKQGYVFLGWTGSNGDDAQEEVTIAKGSNGNKNYTANWRASTDTEYKIEYYIENLNSTENPELEEVNEANYTKYNATEEQTNKIGTTGETVTATPIDITGFTYNEGKSRATISGTVAADGSLVLKVFYTRNKYKLKLVVGDENITSVISNEESSTSEIEKEYKYQEEVTINARLATVEGYTVSFKNWTSSNTSLISNGNIRTRTITIPAGDVTLTATGEKQKARFIYTVEYYYENAEGTMEKDDDKTVTGDPAEFESQILTYESKDEAGYELDSVDSLPLTITANTSNNVIKVYYKLINYNLTYDLQGGVMPTVVEDEFNVELSNPSSYNTKTADFTLNNPEKDRYVFKGWTGGVIDGAGQIDEEAETGTTGNVTTPTKTLTIEKGSLGNRKYTANWEERAYEVIVHHYLEGTGPAYSNDAVVLADDEIFTTKTLGTEYEVKDLIPTYDAQGNITNEDASERNYLDGKELKVVGNSGNTTGTYAQTPTEVTFYYQYYPVIKIVSSPADALNGKEYITIAEALKALKDAELTKDSEVSKLQILRNSKNENVEVNNLNVCIDLNDYTVNSNSETAPTVKVTNAKLTITDESINLNGKVTSPNATGVYVDKNSEFTLGIEARPVEQSPQIIAKDYGIEKEIIGEGSNQEQGTFNFFDGKIIASQAVKGTIDLTPVVYKATATIDEETGNQVSVLSIITDKEARIGRQMYGLLENAIEAAKTNGEQEEIVVIKDLTKEQRVVIPENKNIKLDLDGHTITTTKVDYVIENQGKLEIVDSSANAENIYGNGKITSTTYSTILNGDHPGELEKTYTYEDFVTSETNGFSDVDGKLVSNNIHVGGTANAYTIIDLTEATESYILFVNAEVSCRNNSDYGYVTVTESASKPAYSNTNGRFICISGEVEQADYSTILPAGKKYYVHFGYYKSNSNYSGTDTFTVNSVKLYTLKGGELTITNGKIWLENCETSSSYAWHKQTIVNNGDLYIGSEEANYAYEPYIYSKKGYTELVNGRGNVTVNRGYLYTSVGDAEGISADGNIEINGGTFQTADTSVQHNSSAKKGSSMVINGGTFSHYVYNWSSEKCIINDGTFSYGVRIESSLNPELIINGGEIYSLTVSNTGKTTINNGTFRNINNTGAGANCTIENVAVTQTVINKGTMLIKGGTYTYTGNYISNQGGTLTIEGGTFTKNIQNESYNTSVINISGGTINGTVSNVGTGTVNISGGSISSSGKTINNTRAGIINIYGGTITSSSSTVACVYNESTGTVNIGNKEDETVGATTPAINGINGYGIFNETGTMNYYDGTIKGAVDQAIFGPLNELAEGRDIIISYEGANNQIEVATLGISNRPVAQIGDTTYTSLQSAIDACPDNSETTVKVIDKIYLSRSANIDSNKNIILDLNTNEIKSYVGDVGIINGGNLKILDNTLDIHNVGFENKVDSTIGFNVIDGKLVSVNKEKNKTSNTYIPIDLTSYTGKKVVITVNAKVSSQQDADIGYAIIKDNVTVPTYSTSTGRFIYISGEESNLDYSTTIDGGKMYYLHLGYYKNNDNTSVGDDEFTVNSISYYASVGTIYSKAGVVIANNGTMDLRLVNMRKDSNNESVITNNGTLEINGAKICAESAKSASLINNTENANLTVNSGEIFGYAGSQCAILNNSTNDLLINGGYIKAGIINQNGGTVKLKNCCVRGQFLSNVGGNYAINNIDGNIIIENGYYTTIYNSKSIIYSKKGNITIYNGLFKDCGTGVEVAGEGELTIYNGTFIRNRCFIKLSNSANCSAKIYDGTLYDSMYGIEIRDNASIEILGGTYTTSDVTLHNYKGTADISNVVMTSTGNYTVQNDNGATTNLISGTYVSTRNSENNSGSCVYNNGTLILGEDDGTASKVSPSLSGIGYGVYNNSNGKTYFYDGILEGKDGQAIYGQVIEAQDYNLIKETVTKTINGVEKQRQIAYLDALDIAQVGEERFKSLQLAVNYCTNNEHKTIEIIRDVTIGSAAESVNIPAGKDITIDLKGCNIVASNQTTFQNSGKLEIVDTGKVSGEGETQTTVYGELKNTTGSLFKNMGTGDLTLTSGNISTTQYEYTVNNQTVKCYLASNEGTGKIIVNGATINTMNGINNTSSGEVKVLSGSILGNTSSYNSGRAINNTDENGKVTIEGGSVEAYYSIYMTNGALTINNGTVKGSTAINATGSTEIEITDGTIKGYMYLIDNTKIEISGGTINGEIDLYKSSEGTITGGSFASTSENIECSGSAFVTIEDGTFTSSTYNVLNNAYNNLGSVTTTIKGGTFTTTGKVSIRNMGNNCNMVIEGGTFTADVNAHTYNDAAIENAGTMLIKAAVINGYNGIWNIPGKTNKLTLGVNDGSVDNSSIQINAGNIGVKTMGASDEFYYYDGTITAKEVINGEVTETPTGYRIATTQSGDSVVATLQEYGDVAQIEGVGTYKTLQSAINAVGTNVATIKISNPYITTTTEKAIIANNQNITIDLNGCTIENHGSMFQNAGTLKLIDSSNDKTGIIIGYAKNLIDNTGNLEINANIDETRNNNLILNTSAGSVKLLGGNITTHDNNYYTSSILNTSSSGQVDVNGGVYDIKDYTSTNRTYFIYNTGTGNININGGKVNLESRSSSSTPYGIYTDNQEENQVAKIIISNIEINYTESSAGYGIYGIGICSYGHFNIQIAGAKITNMNQGIFIPNSNSQGILLIDGENVDIQAKESAIYNYSTLGTVEIRNGKLKSTTTYATIINRGTLKIYGGTITSEGGTAIRDAGGNTTIYAGTITAPICGIYGDGNVTVLGGEITTTGDSTSQYGIYLNNSGSIFTLGEKDYPVSRVVPSITSNGYGVYKNNSNAVFNFYDGIITGQIQALNGTVNGTPELYITQLSNEEKVATLEINATFEGVASMDHMVYDSLQVAVTSAGQSAKVIELQKDIVIENPVTIAAGQNITLDLHGYTITMPDGEYAIVNNGTLTIMDSLLTDTTITAKSGIVNKTGTAIYNNGTLTLGVNDSGMHPIVPTIQGKIYGIANSGTINMFDGVIIGETDAIGQTNTISSTPTGYITDNVEEVVDEVTYKKVVLKVNN